MMGLAFPFLLDSDQALGYIIATSVTPRYASDSLLNISLFENIQIWWRTASGTHGERDLR